MLGRIDTSGPWRGKLFTAIVAVGLAALVVSPGCNRSDATGFVPATESELLRSVATASGVGWQESTMLPGLRSWVAPGTGCFLFMGGGGNHVDHVSMTFPVDATPAMTATRSMAAAVMQALVTELFPRAAKIDYWLTGSMNELVGSRQAWLYFERPLDRGMVLQAELSGGTISLTVMPTEAAMEYAVR